MLIKLGIFFNKIYYTGLWKIFLPVVDPVLHFFGGCGGHSL